MPRFADIRAQERAHDFLRRAAARERLPHALLFHGTPGVGKSESAFALAQFLNCEAPTAEDSCGKCSSCSKIHRFAHPDLHWLFPMPGAVKGGKRTVHMRETMDHRREEGIHGFAHVGAVSIAIGRDEDTRAGSVAELRHEAGMMPVEGRVKVFVVTEADRMTQQAANSLLKVLEEPPPGNLLVLTAARPNELLDTIVSRCQLVRFHDLSEELLVELLLERAGPRKATRKRNELGERIPPQPAAAALAAALAGGSLTRGSAFLENEDQDHHDVVSLRDEALAFLSLKPGDPTLHDAVGELASAKNRSLVNSILDFGLLWFGDQLRALTGAEVPLANRDRESEVRRAAERTTVERIQRRVHAITEAREAMRGNVYLPLVLTSLLDGLAEA